MKTKLFIMIIALFAATGIMADNYQKWVDGKPAEGLIKNFQFDPITLTLTAELPDAPNGIMFKYDLYWRTNNTYVTHVKDVMDDDHPNSVDYECWAYQSQYSSTDNYRFDIWKSHSATSKNIEGKPGTKQVSFRLMHDQLQQIYDNQRRKDLFVAMGMFLSSSGMSGDEVKYGESSNMRSWVRIPYHDYWLPDHDEYRENSICFTNAYEFSVPHAMTTAAIVATKSGGEWAQYYNGKRNGYVSPNMTEFSFYNSNEVVTINDSLWYSMDPTVRFNWEYRLDDGEWQTYTAETGMPLSNTEPAIGPSRSLSISPNAKAKYKEEWRAAVTTSNSSYKGEVAYSNVITLYHKFKEDDWASNRIVRFLVDGHTVNFGTEKYPQRIMGGDTPRELQFYVWAKGNSAATVRLQRRYQSNINDSYSEWQTVSGSSEIYNGSFSASPYYIKTTESGDNKRLQYRYVVQSRNGGPTIVSDTVFVDLTRTIHLTGPCDYKVGKNEDWREIPYDHRTGINVMWFDSLYVRPYRGKGDFTDYGKKQFSVDEDGEYYHTNMGNYWGESMTKYYPTGKIYVTDERGNNLSSQTVTYGISLKDQGYKMPAAPERKQKFLGWQTQWNDNHLLSSERLDTMILVKRDNGLDHTITAVYSPKIQGDVNNDTYVNAADVVSVYNCIIEPSDAVTPEDADVNENNEVNAADVVTIYNRIIDGLRAGQPEGVIAVDLGLPSKTLWANFNIGAHSPEEAGHYFAWGELMPKESYTIDNYEMCDFYAGMSYYYRYQRGGQFSDNFDNLFLTDDAAFIHWGARWQMPSIEQFQELINPEYTTTIWTTYKGVDGISIVSKENGNSIFIPGAGNMDGDKNLNSKAAALWSTSLGNLTEQGISFKCSYFNGKLTISYGGESRYKGFNIRPVARKSTSNNSGK